MKKTMLAVLAVSAVTAAAQQPPDVRAVVFRVNGEPVRLAEVNLAAQNLASQLQMQGQQVDRERVSQAAVRQVIDTELLAQEAGRRGIEADREAVDRVMQRFREQHGGAEALATELESSGLDPAWLEEIVTESNLVQSLIDQIRATITVSDEEVERFYADNPDLFESPEQVRARHILFQAGAEATDEEREAARAKAEAARERALGDEEFAELARELSEGPSAAEGGDLGFFTRDRMVEPFASAAFDLEPGEISPVVGTEFGYHVIKLEERKAAGTDGLEDVRDRIRSSLQGQQVDTAVGELLESLHEKAEIVPVGPAAEAGPPAGVAPSPPGADGGTTQEEGPDE